MIELMSGDEDLTYYHEDREDLGFAKHHGTQHDKKMLIHAADQQLESKGTQFTSFQEKVDARNKIVSHLEATLSEETLAQMEADFKALERQNRPKHQDRISARRARVATGEIGA